jgi:hypothetical protein
MMYTKPCTVEFVSGGPGSESQTGDLLHLKPVFRGIELDEHVGRGFALIESFCDLNRRGRVT